MVNKEIIDKVISYSIKKCGRLKGGLKSSLNNFIRQQLYKFFDETKTLEYEKVEYLDNHGNVLIKKKGDRHSWEVKGEDISKIIDDNFNLIMDKGGFHITHNHPSSYRESDMDCGDFTCLSEADMNNLKKTFNWESKGIHDWYFNKSITGDCSNGTRMTLVRNTDSFNPSVFDKARDNLIKNWRKYIKDSKENTKEALWDFVLVWQSKNNTTNLPSSDVLDKEKVEIQKRFAKEHFQDYIQDNIKDFDETGFELSFEWIQ